MANRTKMTPQKKASFLESLRRMPNVARACREAGISRTCAYAVRASDEEFAKAWDEAIKEGVELLEEKAWERAETISDTLMIFLLKAHAPNKYLERRDVTSGGQPLAPITSIEVVLTPDEDNNVKSESTSSDPKLTRGD